MYLSVLVPALCLCCGCSHLQAASRDHDSSKGQKIQLRNNAASLLYDLMNEEKNVSKVFVIKNARPDVVALVKMIANMAEANGKKLELLATNDPALNLSALDLPPGEKAARDSEAKSQEHDLLFSTGANFEFNLLMTQAQALNYGSHLAAVAAETSPLPTEAQGIKSMSDVMKHLYEQTITQMRSLPPP